MLDCTLRDGGYINDWVFGYSVIKKIITGLENANIDIIECGFIEDKPFDADSSVFSSVEHLNKILDKKNHMYVAMIALGDIDISKIPKCDPIGIDGIRLTFHKEDINAGLTYAKRLIEKGYKTFVQPVGSTNYSDSELLELVHKVNVLNPFAFYIVDTLGMMYPRDVIRTFSIVDNNLDSGIAMGFHSHNNLQLSFSNAQSLIGGGFNHDIILDSSVLGMGRGAGNLCTELITNYLNSINGYRYDIIPILDIIDKYISEIRQKTHWGYSAHHYLSAVSSCHPNYAAYLMSKKTLNINDISKILNSIPTQSRGEFNRTLMEAMYLEYQKSKVDDTEVLTRLKRKFEKKDVIIVAPGPSSTEFAETINSYDSALPRIHVNEIVPGVHADMVFISNKRKFDLFESQADIELITTSNVGASQSLYQVDYSSLLCGNKNSDNAGLMLITLLANIGVKCVKLAGFDGYCAHIINTQEFDSYSDMIKEINYRNANISSELSRLSKRINIEFITPSSYSID